MCVVASKTSDECAVSMAYGDDAHRDLRGDPAGAGGFHSVYSRSINDVLNSYLLA